MNITIRKKHGIEGNGLELRGKRNSAFILSIGLLFVGLVAFLPKQAQSSNVWIGEGADEYYSTSNNKVGGPAGRGMYFVDGVTDLNGVVQNVSSRTIRFNSYTRISGTSIYVGRASLEDPNQIWTFIPDNDECGFYLDDSYSIELGSYSDYGNGYLRIKNGKCFAKNLNIGTTASKGWLSIGSQGHSSLITTAEKIEVRNGSLIATNTSILCNGLIVANRENASAMIEKVGGDWCINGSIKMNGDKATTSSTFYNQDGNLIVSGDFLVQDRGSGEFYMEGGHVTVSNIVRFAEYWLADTQVGKIYLNGGIFEAKAFRFHNGDNYGYVIFNGGTYKAMSDGSMALNTGVAATDGRLGAVARLHFKVGERGGVIDTAGYDVIFPLRLLKDGNGNGGISIKGGGSLTLENSNITYAGKTRIEAGTMLVVSNSTVSANILSQGIELAGAPVLNTPYTLFKCNDDLNAETDLANVTCDAAIEFDKFIGDDGKSIVVTVTALKSGWWTGSAGDNNLSTAGNWADSIVPTSGNVEIYSPIATTLNVGDTFNANTISIPKTSAVVTIGSGNLQLNTLTNASRLAVASGASLTIEGNMVLTESGTVLHSNEGTVLVKGVVDFMTNSNGNRTYYQYEVVTDATMPIMAGGLAYNGPSNYLTVYLGKDTDSQLAGQWVIGEKGMYYKSSRNIWHTGFMMGQGKTTLYSCADWSLSSSGRGNSTRDLGNYYNAGSTVIKNSSLVLDTNNYTNNAVSHTITLNGRLISSATTDPAVTIKGAGTVVVNTSEGVGRDGYQKTSIGTTLAVTDTATLMINAGKSIIGDGKISLGAGTTLALESTASTFTTQNILPVILPETGTVTIRINGTKLKGGVDYAICTLTDLSDGYNVSDHVTVTGTALDGRKYEVKADKAVENEETVTKLVLNIYPAGLMVIVR